MARRVYVFELAPDVSVIVAARAMVLDAFDGIEAFSRQFPIYVSMGGILPPSAFLGVSGKRDSARFERTLIEQLGPIEIVRRGPPTKGRLQVVIGS